MNGDGQPVVMTPEIRQALASLHDLQLVEVGLPQSARELALPVALAVVAALLLLAARTYWRRRPRQQRLRRLAALAREAGGVAGTPAPLADLAELLREAAASAAMPPGLSGDAWLAWLDERAPAADRGAFADGIGRQLLFWPYAPPSNTAPEPASVAELFALVRRWLKVNG